MTRDVTAWACQLVPSASAGHALRRGLLPPMCFADLWSRADAVGKLLPAWARLGPLSMSGSLRRHSHRRLPATDRCRGRSPKVGVAERFPDWTAVGFRACDRRPRAVEPCLAQSCCADDLPDPARLGSRALRRASARLWPAGSDAPLIGGLSPRGADGKCIVFDPPPTRVRSMMPKHRAHSLTDDVTRTTHSRCCVTCGDSNPTCLMGPFRAH